MEKVKEYLTRLCDLTITRQIKWERRANSGPHIFECRITQDHSVAIHFEATYIPRVSLTIANEDGSALAIANINPNGDIQKILFKLWDIVLLLNLNSSAEKWLKTIPETDKKIKFGPKDVVA